MKVILSKSVPGVGKAGEIKEVSEGYGNNFILKKGFGRLATAQELTRQVKEAKEAAGKQERQVGQAKGLKQKLETQKFTAVVKVGEQGQVFSGVHEKDIAELLSQKLHATIEKSQIHTPPLKTLGEHKIKVKLGHGLSAETTLIIQAEQTK